MLGIDIGILFLALLIILAGSQFFTNALEHVGQRLSLSEGLVGSVFAAVATALPETLVPVVAVLFGGANLEIRSHVGIGAILGAPLMLVSIAMALLAVFAGMKRGWHMHLKPEISGFLRDLLYFMAAFIIALLSLFIPAHPPGARILVGVALVFLYISYVANTVRASKMLVLNGHGTRTEHRLWLQHSGIPHALWTELTQLTLGLMRIHWLVLGSAAMVSMRRVTALRVSRKRSRRSPELLSLASLSAY